MTITPLPVRPAAASGPVARGGQSSGDPAGFAALVSRETDRLAGGTRDGAPVGDGSADPDGGPAPAPAGDVPVAVVLPVVAATGDLTSGVAAIDPEGAGPVPGAPQVEAGTVIVDAAVHGQVAQPGGDLAGTAVTSDGDPALAPTGDVAPRAGTDADQRTSGSTARVGGEGVTALPGSEGAPDTTDGSARSGPAPEVSVPSPSAGAGATSSGPAATPGPDVANAPVVTATTAATGAETAGGGSPTGETARTTTALLDQVSPTLTRLVARGDGEHRMTLKIHPADLGEVHLTVTVRGERVDVDIAASAEARELLRDGLVQLRSLLDPTGRGGGQLVFRDLPTAPAGQSVSAETATGGDPGDRSGASDGSAERHDGRGSHPGSPAARTGATGEPTTETAVPPTPRGAPGVRTVDVTI